MTYVHIALDQAAYCNIGDSSEIRQTIYKTNTIVSLNMPLPKVTKNSSFFPNKEAVFNLIYLALRNINQRWTMAIRNWSDAMNQFAILF
jgi:putative transposase